MISYSPHIVTDGLVLCLDAANPRSYPLSGTSWNDLSGNGNHGTLTNGPTFNNSNGGNIVFDGTNDHIRVTDNVSMSSIGDADFSLTALIKPTTSAITKNILRRDNVSNLASENRRIISIAINSSGHLSFGVYDGNSNSALYTQNLCDNNWHYVCGVYLSSSNTQSLYENGILRAESIYNNTLSFNTARSPWCIGNVNTIYNGEWYTGNISQVAIYNKALTPEEIRQNFNATRGRYGY